MINLSEAASKLTAIARNEQFAFEEMDAFYAPSECGDLIVSGYDRDREAVAANAGFATYEALIEAISARTSPRWVHFNL